MSTPDTNVVRATYATAATYRQSPDPERVVEFDRWLAGVKADAIEQAARDLRATECGPYESESGMGGDDWGNDSNAIDTWYAAWLEAFAAKYRQEAER